MPKPSLPNQIAISSSFNGTLHVFFTAIGWLIASAIVGMICWASFSTTLHLLAIEVGHEIGWGEATHLLYAQDGIQEIWFILKGLGWLICAWIFLVNVMTIINCFYYATWKNVIDFKKKTITEHITRFPFRYYEHNNRFDRIVEIMVSQNSLQRIFGIGSIRLTFIRNENFESVRTHWWIYYIDNPLTKKRNLEHLLSQGGTEAMVVSKGSGKQ